MAKHYKNHRLKYLLVAFACTAAFSLSGIAAACKDKTDDGTDEEDKKTSVEDSQLLKNGNFEFFETPSEDKKAEYYLYNPTSWSGAASSYTKSGIIGTSQKAWEALTAENLSERLDRNNDLDSNDSNYKDEYIDFNGLKSSDLLYKDTYAALNDKDEDNPDRKEFIENPETHYSVVKEGDNYYATVDGDKKQVYVDDKGDYYLAKNGDKFEEPISHVLMVHNYSTSHNGLAQNYSSVTVELPANTAAEISVWVKTAYLKYQQGSDVEQDRGANITVTHTAGSTTLDDFSITGINTEKLIKEGSTAGSNGWVQYTVYVNACDFTSSNITLKLGLGEESYKAEGYAFFDDVKVSKFKSLDSEGCSYSDNISKLNVNGKNAVCDLASDESEKIFIADSYSRNGGAITDVRFSKNFHYFIDLASSEDYRPIDFANAKAGLTVDDDDYVSSTSYDGKLKGFTTSSLTSVANAKLPKNFTSLITEKDLLAYVKAGYTFTSADTEYYETLNSALKSADSLPKVNSATQNNMLVMLSAYGAAYTSSFDLSVAGKGHKIVSFWVKTSDMGGSKAATITVTEKINEETTATLAVESTDVTTDIDDNNKDIYNGWVQCFVFIENQNSGTSGARDINFEFSFGNTTIKDTTLSAYKFGWAAIANVQVLDVDEDVFSYTGSGTYSTTLTITEDEEKTTNVFDEVYGSQSNKIKTDIVNPSTYSGVNGASSTVVNNGAVSLPFDEINNNANAGLINKKYFESYKDKGWYSQLLNSFNVSSADATVAWNEIFGSASTQPLIIVNSLRDGYLQVKGATAETYKNYYTKDEDGNFVAVGEDDDFDETITYYNKKQVLNYGFIGSNQTISADGYSTVSVRVKVSAGAVAYVYLVDSTAGKEVLTFNAPNYSFYYDEDGNVLKGEPKENATLAEQRANLLYTLRSDGLYEDENGKIFANTLNYIKTYEDESVVYYNADGEIVSFDDLEDGEVYYTQNKQIANHFLSTKDGKRVYEYKDGAYYYLVDNKATTLVNTFDINYARYNNTKVDESYCVKIDGNESGVAGKWITVNFVINAGSEAKNYRLEVWSGARDEFATEGNTQNGTVIFDYSYATVSDGNSASDYENEIKQAYISVLDKKNLLKDEAISSSTENVKYFSDLVAKYISEGKLSESDLNEYPVLKNYTAHYYTFSLYDSQTYVPFNKDTASENQTGYDYDVNNYSETLSYLSVKDDDSYSIFADYSSIDQSFTINSDDDSDNGGNDGEEEEKKDTSTVWLLVSSILLVVALVFAVAAIMIKDAVKKMRRNKVTGKNNYDQQKRTRYMRKLHIKEENVEEVENPVNETSEAEEIGEVETVVENSEKQSEEANAENGENVERDEAEIEQQPEEKETENNETNEEASENSDGEEKE